MIGLSITTKKVERGIEDIDRVTYSVTGGFSFVVDFRPLDDGAMPKYYPVQDGVGKFREADRIIDSLGGMDEATLTLLELAYGIKKQVVV